MYVPINPDRCDVVITIHPNTGMVDFVYINDTPIGRVYSIQQEADPHGLPIVVLTMYPSSVVIGDVPVYGEGAIDVVQEVDDAAVERRLKMDKIMGQRAQRFAAIRQARNDLSGAMEELCSD